jgi:hypothetical protein
MEKLAAKSTSQITARPPQIHRDGKTNSRQIAFGNLREKSKRLSEKLRAFWAVRLALPLLFNSATTSCRMSSSLGSMALCRANMISRGVFIFGLQYFAQ